MVTVSLMAMNNEVEEGNGDYVSHNTFGVYECGET